MCGIVGAIGLLGQPVPESLVRSMMQAVAHRGPDSADLLRISDSVLLGHTRLAIFDTSAQGAQPMRFENTAISYNGEVYNFKQLRTLLGAEATFHSSCDTEIVLRWLATHGVEGVEDFDGFFAFAFWNGKELLLGRDRFGQKPLYYTTFNGMFLFASEIKSLVAVGVPLVARKSVRDYVSRYRFADTLSPFETIEMIPPASILRFDPAAEEPQSITNYYRLPSPGLDKAKVDEASHVDRTEELLCAAVYKRLAADVPVGVILSGGLDSSLIAWAARNVGPVELFHVDVQGRSERQFAEEVAKFLECPLHVVSWGAEDYQAARLGALLSYEFPMVHPNSTAIKAVADLAREHGVRVLLGGEGADELFGGYVHQERYYWLMRLQKIAGRGVVRFLSGSQYPAARWKQHSRGSDRNIEADIESRVAEGMPHCNDTLPEYTAFLQSDFLDYLPPLLLRGDKMSMAAGVELRLPFMDRFLVEHAIVLPVHLRYRKKVLRQIAQRHLPARIANRRKVGFPFPDSFFGMVQQGMRNESDEFVASLDELTVELMRQYGP